MSLNVDLWQYLETVSSVKPWHACILLVLKKDAFTEKGEAAETSHTIKDSPLDKCEFRLIPARLRTYSSTPVRPGLGRISPSGLEAMFKQASGARTKRGYLLNKIGENKYHATDAPEEGRTESMLAFSSLAGVAGFPRANSQPEVTETPPAGKGKDAKEATEVVDEQAQFLFAHFDFDFNAKQLVSRGTEWFNDYGHVLK